VRVALLLPAAVRAAVVFDADRQPAAHGSRCRPEA
jgi:hypothetical protein